MAVDRTQIVELILRTARLVVEELDEDKRFIVDETSELAGGRKGFDSLSLLTFLVELEEAVQMKFGRNIRLGDAQALSEPVLPFKDVARLAQYLEKRLTRGESA
jgi:acyl carrier protein